MPAPSFLSWRGFTEATLETKGPTASRKIRRHIYFQTKGDDTCPQWVVDGCGVCLVLSMTPVVCVVGAGVGRVGVGGFGYVQRNTSSMMAQKPER